MTNDPERGGLSRVRLNNQFGLWCRSAEIVMRLARMLKLYIAAEGLEQKRVAEEIGIGESTLSRFMSGDALPAADAYARVLAWCSGTNVPPADALARIERLEAQVGNLNQRTVGLVRMGGR